MLAARALIAQRELQRVARGLQPGLLQRPFELRRVAAEKVERLGAVDDETRRDVAVGVDVEPHVYAAELRRIEADLEVLFAGRSLRRDLDRQSAHRHVPGGRHCVRRQVRIRGRGARRLPG